MSVKILRVLCAGFTALTNTLICFSSDLLPLDLLARALPGPGQAPPTQVGHLRGWREQ